MSNVLKVSKKVLTVGTVMSTMLWSVGVAALLPVAASAATCPAFKSGDLLKVSGKPAIYAVDSNGKVLYFPSGDEFKSWNVNETYGGYTTVSQECYDAMPVPSMSPFGVNFRAGSYIVKRASSDQLYVVLPNNTLSKITAEAANALYGVGHKTMTVADVFWPNYTARGADVTEAKAQPGMLVSNGGKTWYVDASSKLWEVSAAGMSANRFKAAFVRPVSDAAVAGLVSGGTLSDVNAVVADRTQSGGGSATIPGTVVTGGALTVSLAANNPAGNILASGSAFNQVLKLNLSAGSSDVSVTGLTLRKAGFAGNSVISGIDLIDSAGNRHGNVASSVNADSDVTLLFAGSPITVKAGSTEVVTVRVNLGSTATAGTLSMNVLGASSVTSNGSVGGSFPVSGNVFTLQDGSNSLAAVTLNGAAVNASGANLNVDANNEQEIAKFTIAQTNSKENVKLAKLTLYNNGTASDSDVMDVQLVAQDGSVLATAQQISKNVVFDLSANAYPIDKGQTKTFTVRAKIVNGAARTIQFVVYNDYDAVITGVSTGASILPTTNSSAANNSTTSFPVGNKAAYNVATVASGTMSFNKDTTSPSAAVAPNTNGVVLAKYFAKPNGESMELRKIALGLQSGSLASMYSGSFTVKVNGASVYSGTPSDITSSSVSLTSLTLSTYPVLTAGQNNYITVEANVNSQAANGATTTVYLDLTEVKRLVTNDITDPGVGISQANQISVQAAALKITTLATPVAQSIVVGTSNVILAQIELNPSTVSSGEDVRVSKLVFTDTLSGSGMADIANLVLYDQNGNALATSASTALNATSTTFTLSNPITISKTGSVVLTLKGDVVANAGSGSHTYKIGATGDVTATGKDTGNSPSLTLAANTGQALTIANAGTLSLSLVSGSNGAPSSNQIVSAGQTNVPVFAFKLTAQKEAVKLTSLTLTATGTIRTVNDLSNIKLYRNNETTPFASASQMVSSTVSPSNALVFTWTATDNLLVDAIQPNAPVTIYVKADVGSTGQVVLGDSFFFKISSTTDIVAKGSSSGSSASVSGSATASGVSYISPFNVSIAGDAPSANSSATQAIGSLNTIARFKITNNGSSKVTITGIRFTDSGSHSGGTTSYRLYYSDLSSSNYLNGTASTSQAITTPSTTIDFTGLGTTGGSSSFTIDGGAYRFVSLAINAIGAAATGDTWQISISTIGDVTYTSTEADLGYDTNNDGTLSGSTYSLYADGKPSVGALQKL